MQRIAMGRPWMGMQYQYPVGMRVRYFKVYSLTA